jgi:muramoyltetrapeptide carboxypeptidase
MPVVCWHLKPYKAMAPLNKKPILPPRLKPGDTIGIVAPAGPFDKNIFKDGIQTLTSMGFRIHIPDG